MAFASGAQAESHSKQTAEAHYDKAMKDYTLGHFPEAIEEFEKAYDLRPEPIFLFNIAQSHRHDNNPQRAIFFYRRYLEAEPNAANRPDIEKRIQELEAQINDQRAMAAAPAPNPAAPTPEPVVAPPAPVSEPAAAPAPAAEAKLPPVPLAARKPGAGLRIAGITTASVGVIGIGLGIASGLHAKTLYDQAWSPGHPYDYSKDQSSQTYHTLEWVSFAAGGAALVTGGVLYYLGWSEATDTRVTLVPVAAPGTGGAALYGRF